jgi:hypothetical protein
MDTNGSAALCGVEAVTAEGIQLIKALSVQRFRTF